MLDRLGIEKKQRAERLIRRGGAHVLRRRQMGKKLGPPRFPPISGVLLAVEKDELAHPLQINLLGPPTAIIGPENVARSFHKFGACAAGNFRRQSSS